MRIKEIKKHFEEKAKILIKNDEFRIQYLHESVTNVLSIFIRKQNLIYYICDDITHEKDFAIDFNYVNNTYYCNSDALEVFIEMLDILIDKQLNIDSYSKTITKETIISKLRKNKIEKIITNE